MLQTGAKAAPPAMQHNFWGFPSSAELLTDSCMLTNGVREAQQKLNWLCIRCQADTRYKKLKCWLNCSTMLRPESAPAAGLLPLLPNHHNELRPAFIFDYAPPSLSNNHKCFRIPHSISPHPTSSSHSLGFQQARGGGEGGGPGSRGTAGSELSSIKGLN